MVHQLRAQHVTEPGSSQDRPVPLTMTVHSDLPAWPRQDARRDASRVCTPYKATNSQMPDGVSVAFEPKICRYLGLGPDLIVDDVTGGHVHWTKPTTHLFAPRHSVPATQRQPIGLPSLVTVGIPHLAQVPRYLSLEPNNATEAAEEVLPLPMRTLSSGAVALSCPAQHSGLCQWFSRLGGKKGLR